MHSNNLICNFSSRIHCLECLASLFTDDNYTDNHSHDLIHTLYKKIHTYPLPTLFDVLKQPFNNVRSSCYKVLHSLSSFPWMLADMKITPGTFELTESHVIERIT